MPGPERESAYLRVRALVRQLRPDDCGVERLNVGRYFGVRFRGPEGGELLFG
jgi:hypothetical protein